MKRFMVEIIEENGKGTMASDVSGFTSLELMGISELIRYELAEFVRGRNSLFKTIEKTRRKKANAQAVQP